MINDIPVLYLIIGFIVGGICIFMICAQFSKMKVRLLTEQLNEAKMSLLKNEELAKQNQEEWITLCADKARLEQKILSYEHELKEKESFLASAEQLLSKTFAELSAQSLKTAQSQFLELAQSKMEDNRKLAVSDLDRRTEAVQNLVKPVEEQLKNIQELFAKVEQSRVGAYEALNTEIKNIKESNLRVEKEAGNLSRALRNPGSRGQWGELQLRRVIEMAGMMEHCDFITQVHIKTEEGKVQRPDVRVNLPGERFIYIDSKTPYEAYVQGLHSEDEALRRDLMIKHVADIKKHIKELSGKNYDKNEMSTPDFVVLFLPSESFFQTALEYDTSLIEFGSTHNIILATPTTLIALLKAIAYGWQQEALAQNAKNIIAEASRLLDRCGVLDKHFQSLGKNLKQTVQSFNSVAASYETNLLSSALRLKKMGVSTKEKINEEQELLIVEPKSLTKVDKLRAEGELHEIHD